MQNKVKEFNEKNGRHAWPMPVHARILDSQSEMGELAKEYLKNSDYGDGKFVLTDDFLMEYGDVLYCLLSLANELGISAEDCLDMAIKKYQKRIDEKKTMGSEKE